MLDITQAGQVSKLIDESVKVADALVALRDALARYDLMTSVNDASNVLTAPGAAFPEGFNTTPAIVNNARFALASVRADLEAALTGDNAGRLTSINNLRLDLGVLTGSG